LAGISNFKMAGLFNSVVSLGKTALGKIQGSSDPNVVKAVNPTEFATVPTQVIVK
jgi:hypothetical protein